MSGNETSERLASLYPNDYYDEATDTYVRFNTYMGGCIGYNSQGNLRLSEVLNDPDDARPMRERYQSACIRISGGFDD